MSAFIVDTMRDWMYGLNMEILDDERILAIIREQRGDQSLRSYARAIGVTAAYLSDVLARKRSPGRKILSYFGIDKTKTTTVTYRYTIQPDGKD